MELQLSSLPPYRLIAVLGRIQQMKKFNDENLQNCLKQLSDIPSVSFISGLNKPFETASKGESGVC